MINKQHHLPVSFSQQVNQLLSWWPYPSPTQFSRRPKNRPPGNSDLLSGRGEVSCPQRCFLRPQTTVFLSCCVLLFHIMGYYCFLQPPLSWGDLTYFLLCMSLGSYLITKYLKNLHRYISAEDPLRFLSVNHFSTAIFELFWEIFHYLATVSVGNKCEVSSATLRPIKRGNVTERIKTDWGSKDDNKSGYKLISSEYYKGWKWFQSAGIILTLKCWYFFF